MKKEEKPIKKRLLIALRAKRSKCTLNSPFASCLALGTISPSSATIMSLFSLPPHLLPTNFWILSSSTTWFWTSEIQSPLTALEHGHLPCCTELLAPLQHPAPSQAGARKVSVCRDCIWWDRISSLCVGWWNELYGENGEPDGGMCGEGGCTISPGLQRVGNNHQGGLVAEPASGAMKAGRSQNCSNKPFFFFSFQSLFPRMRNCFC